MLLEVFEQKLPDYYKTDSIRQSQVQMAFDIAAFLHKDNKEKIMLIEAPVGTGKSLGSLVPCLIEREVNKESEQILYATATINLQSQLMNSEIPLLKKLKMVKKPILAKGKAHYYCHDRFMRKKHFFSPKDRDIINDFYLETSTGHRDELEKKIDNLSEKKWDKINLESTAWECRNCAINQTCATYDHRNRFKDKENDLIVTNHDQFIVSVLNAMEQSGRNEIVPTTPGILIIDEAHHFMERFLSQLEKSFTLTSLKKYRRSINRRNQKRYSRVLSKIEDIVKVEKDKLKSSLQGRYALKEPILRCFEELKEVIDDSISSVEAERIHTPYYADGSFNELDEISEKLSNLLNDKYVKWIEYEFEKFIIVSDSFPTDFKVMMDYITRYNKVIVMSGTFTQSGSFDAVIAQWRLKRESIITANYDTPFDYANQALIYIPENISHPNDEGHMESATTHIENLLRLTNGSTLILCTAKEQIAFIETKLEQTLKHLNINCYVQGQSGVEKLTALFKEDIESVLIGSGSFFSGFSIPGSSLISTALTKLPFSPKDDPFLKLIGQGYEDDFFEYIIFPEMVNKLNQAAGRLIRSIDDYGIFTITDPRIFEATYSREVISIFEKQGYIITRSLEDVMNFIAHKRKKGTEAKYIEYDKSSLTIELCLNDIIQDRSISLTPKLQTIQEPPKVKQYGVTKKQRNFMKEICEREGIQEIKVRESKKLYEKLMHTFYHEWKDDVCQYIKDNFPYRDEEERELLHQTEEGQRKVVMPFCRKWNCSGDCSEKENIERYLKSEYNPETVSFRKHSHDNHCRVMVTPTTILQKEEFRPV